MEKEGHVGDDDVVAISKKFISGVISELSGSESVEASDSSEQSAFLG